ncbi:MAG: hypothetical protein ACRDSF_18455 [Pseudonocardiaceae bacterium]
MNLDIGSQIELLLLQRVHAGHITEFCELYFDDGRRIWHTATRALRTLTEVGRLALGEPGPDRSRPVALTEFGLDRYAALCERARADHATAP